MLRLGTGWWAINYSCSSYRRIICSCRYYQVHFLVVANGRYYVPVVAKWGFLNGPGSIYRSILSSFSYYWKIFLLEHPTQKRGHWAVPLSLCHVFFFDQLSERSQVSLASLLLGRCQDLKIKLQSVIRSHHTPSFPEHSVQWTGKK